TCPSAPEDLQANRLSHLGGLEEPRATASASADDRMADRIVTRLKEFSDLQRRLDTDHKLILATSSADLHGITSVCAESFCRLDGSHVCLWFDMNDIPDTDSLFEVILEAAHGKLGSTSWTSVYMEHTSRHRANELRRLSGQSAKPWTLFLNARETPGANVASEPGEPNGWLAHDSDDRKTFLELLANMCGPES